MRKQLILLPILVVAGTSSALACNCPKEQLIKEYGTVSPLGRGQARPGPVQPIAAQTTPAKSLAPAALPLLVPIRANPAGTGPTSLEWLLFEP